MIQLSRLLAVMALGLTLIFAWASPSPAQAQAQTLNYQNADIRAVVQDVARVTGRTFIVDPRVQGTVTVVSNQALSRTELFNVFVSTLRANGLVVTQTASGAYRIAPSEGAASLAGSGGAEQFVTEVFRLTTVDAVAAAEVLRPLVSAEGQVLPNADGNTLVVADYADNIRRIRTILAQLDQDRASVQTVTLANTSASEIAEVLTQVLGLATAEEGGSSLLSVVPVASSNSIVLRGDPDTIARALPIIAELDARAAARGDVQVIPLQYADAAQLLPVLQQLVGIAPTAEATSGDETGEAAAVGASAAGGAPVAIARYPGANALIISANPETQRTLAEVIRRLDTRRQQVLVEAIIVEVSDTAARELGVQYLLGGGDDGEVPLITTNYTNSAPSILSLTGALIADDELEEDSELLQSLRTAAINSLTGANGLVAGVGGQNDDGVIFGLILNAVRSDTGSNILSTPSVMTLDNVPATFLGGQEVPVSTGEVLGDNNNNPFRTIERRDVGVQLEVTPQINAGGVITLNLRVEVSSVAGPISSDFQELIFNKRELTTTVAVDDGDILVLGGLLNENERVSVDGIPGLSRIPGVGALFRSDGTRRERTNLMIFLRPRIIRTTADARNVTADRYQIIRDAEIAAGSTDRTAGTSALEGLVREYLRTDPPAHVPPVLTATDPVEAQPLPAPEGAE